MKPRVKFILMLAAALLVLADVTFAQEGPNQDVGNTVAKPRKKGSTTEETQQPRIPSKYSKKDRPDVPAGLTSFKAETTLVNLDIAVIDKNGHFIPNIPRGNFRVLEDNVPQKIETFTMGEAPMTVCLVIEFSNLFQQYWSETWYQTLTASYGFLDSLKPTDYVAVVAYDMRPEILTDFTTDKRKAYDAMRRLQIPAFSESNLYDAVTDTAQRMSGIEGRKAIVLISSGIDTFSKITYGKARTILQNSGVPIYAIGLMQAVREWYDAMGMMGSIARLDFLQADNTLNTFARETGGMAFFPRFYGEFPNIFQQIQIALRSRYDIGYQPSNMAKDGKFRKIKVELVNPANNEPLRIVDQKGKPVKYRIIARNGYTAPRAVE